MPCQVRIGGVELFDTVMVDTLSTNSAETDFLQFNSSVADASSVSVSGTLPVLYINTENGAEITSKTEYINATYWLDGMGIEGSESMGTEQNPMLMQIRGRGNSSWKSPKKPYKIKLADKLSVLGMPPNRHWALLKGNSNTLVGMHLGKLMEMEWTPRLKPVEVVLNGNYIGFYLLTENVRVGKNRVDIYKQADEETNPDLITGGWLVEVDNYREDCQITIPENKNWNLTLRYHAPEVLSKEQKDWLTAEFKAINAAIYQTNKASREWEHYIDVESMARYFILQEVMDNPDGFHGSFYLHKDLLTNAKWIAGPIWDIVCLKREKTDYTFRMKASYGFTPHWIGEIIQYASFCKAVEQEWHKIYPSLADKLDDFLDLQHHSYDQAWINDAERWGDPFLTAKERSQAMKDALRSNIEWFNNHLPQSIHTPTTTPNFSANNKCKVFSIQGIFVGEYTDREEACRQLPTGLYVVDGKKLLIQAKKIGIF